MDRETSTRRKREINEEDLRRLLARLHPDPVRGWQIYGNLRDALLTYFDRNHCLDPEQLADDTLDRIAAKSDGYLIGNLLEFAFGIARNLRHEADRQMWRHIDLSDSAGHKDLGGKQGNVEDGLVSQIDMERKLACLRKCLAQLAPEDRHLVYEYHRDDSNDLDRHRRTLAGSLHLSVGSLRTRVYRIRRKLEECFERWYQRSQKKE